ncbi:hypothetical protein PHYPO_G00110650 [Pangasianodon hypophthalmus]|uniref:PDZ domain-containing protein n=1 Tax=Pangasianodon hypophthalmus TaxID=310915 RepID=A0A5N5L204_PANHP|nr:hypothetical protein PHYPO_G00110650 [Pangasianodon hypophthalmus]
MGCRLSGPWMSDGTMGVSAQDLRYIRNHEALRILANYEQPITVQIEGRRGRGLQYHRSSDSSTQTERPWDNVTSDRPCFSHMTLPGNHGDGGRYEYLPNTPRDLEDMRTVPRHDPEFSPKAAQKQNCLLSCCSSNMEEPSSFQSQTEDEDYVLEKTVGYLPLHHELDSGLGWTDGSFHQGELSGVETEEGLDECHAHQGGRGARVRGGSPSSESFISSELSDSGFYSVSTAEFLRFQRLLEKRMRVYNSRLHHQGELQNLCMDAQKAHRELEAIPEALATQPDSECVETDAHPRQMVRVASVQLRKSERPCLNRHSSSSAAIFSTCSSPSGQQRVLTPRGTTAAGMLRRSRTLHHRPVHVEQRRRASHPASPNYCSVTLNRYGHALQQQLTEETETDVLQPSLSSSTDDHRVAPPQESYCHDNRGRSFTEPPTGGKEECEKETGERERGRFHTLSHTPSQEGNDTWPKTTNRHGPYNTLEGHVTTTTSSAHKPPSGAANPRAMRNQLLRERALRLADERSGGISTDDETNVEIRRVGRYWSRSERREQVLQKQRQKREALRGGGANNNTSMGGDSSGYSALMELSQRKLSRLRNRKLLDDWTTVEELLTHGTRLGTHDENVQIPNSLLTVTTV